MTKGMGPKRGRGRARGGGRAAAAARNASPSALDIICDFKLLDTSSKCQSEATEQVTGVFGPSLLPDAACVPESIQSLSEAGENPSSMPQIRSTKGQKLCEAIDAEVASRAAILRAHTAGRIAAFNAQMDLQLSKLSSEEQNMLVDDFLRSFSQKMGAENEHFQLLQSTLLPSFTKATDCMTKHANSVLSTPCLGTTIQGASLTKENRNQRIEQVSNPEVTSWSEYHSYLQNLGYKAGPTLSGNPNSNTPMNLTCGTTPKTVRLPKYGESMLSVNGSPLGNFGETPATASVARITRSQARGKSSKRSLRDL